MLPNPFINRRGGKTVLWKLLQWTFEEYMMIRSGVKANGNNRHII